MGFIIWAALGPIRSAGERHSAQRFARQAVLASAVSSPEVAGLAEPDGSLWTSNGSWPAIPGLSSPTIGWAAHPGGGAWVVAGDGGVFSFGGAPFYGSTGGIHLAQPVAGMAATPSGHGYWLVASDGGIFAFGDARFYGSTGGIHLAQPVVGLAGTPTGAGYWLVAADGGVFSFGAAPFAGSASGRIAAPAASVDDTASGYRVVAEDGSVWAFSPGSAPIRIQLPVPASELAAVREQVEAQRAVDTALAQVGKPYVDGATGPGAYDCSGLSQYSFAAAGVGLPRTAAEQFAATAHVSGSAMRPGDLVFFYPGITHVGIYLGNGQMVDAPHPGAAVRVEPVQYFGPLEGASRPTIGH